MRPRDAQVLIDGSYAGTVDDFDGPSNRFDSRRASIRWNSYRQATSPSVSTFGSSRVRRSRIEAI